MIDPSLEIIPLKEKNNCYYQILVLIRIFFHLFILLAFCFIFLLQLMRVIISTTTQNNTYFETIIKDKLLFM